MKKGQEITGKVVDIKFPNQGIVLTEDGNRLVVKNSLPGQTVRARVNKIRHGNAEAALLEVISKAECENGEGCPHFGACGGCTYISMDYETEMKLKENMVKKLLEPVLNGNNQNTFSENAISENTTPENTSSVNSSSDGPCAVKTASDYVWEPICGSPVRYGYRNKMEFTFGDEYMGGPLSLGMHKRGSFYDIVNVSECRIVDEDYRKILSSTVDFFRKENIPFYHRLRHTGYLRHLLVRKAAMTGEIMVAIVTSTQLDYDMTGYVSMLRSLELKGSLVSIIHTFNDSQADMVSADSNEILYGTDYINEKVLGLDFKITEFSFFQTNTYSAEVLYSTARQFIKEINSEMNSDKKIGTLFDLYSGTGTIAQLMAPSAEKVIGVEIVEEAVVAARENAKRNGLDNCEFIAGDVLKVIDEIEDKPDMIILDPPRDGIHPKALPKIVGYGVHYILYISCKPTSLARDLEYFIGNGYEVKRIRCVDQFPWTGHVETVCLLSRKAPV